MQPFSSELCDFFLFSRATKYLHACQIIKTEHIIPAYAS